MDLRVRAGVLAALAEPARLRIVDLLSAGDASPSELRDALGMPSNLLAHHLGVLEARGIVSRQRSHGDRRRTYLRLRPDALAGLLPGVDAAAGSSVERVVFVCSANSARSQLANALWQHASTIPSTSAGTHPVDDIAPGAVAVARRRGLRLIQQKPQALDTVFRPSDFVVTVCDGAHEELASARVSGPAGWPTRVVHWSVPDPVAAGTVEAFDDAYDEIADRVAELASRLARRIPSPDTSTAS